MKFTLNTLCPIPLRVFLRVFATVYLTVLLTACSTALRHEDSDYTKLDDGRNETLALKNIRASHQALDDAHVNVNSFKGYVLISGQVDSPELIALATNAVSKMRNVKRVHNELIVAGPTSQLSRINDSYLSTKVRAMLSASENIQGNRIKVVTENDVVYLMGVITRQEAHLAVEVARQVYGIQKIVKVFDYLN
jgi:osmotically-inducible protein OsmY|tara:strand:+ start:1496 stop:2074 length:579 start_codon:yes stop_codon:yes gene_type:complete